MEFQNNTGDCFISDSTLAANFGVSESTITRALKALEAKGLITRETKNTRSGKERHISVNLNKV
jgi:predicted transcriptional regulator